MLVPVGTPTTATGGTTAVSISRANVTPGAGLVLTMTWFQTVVTALPLPVDSQGQTVTVAKAPTPTGPASTVYMVTGSWVIPASLPGTHTFTVTIPGGTGRWHASILEVAGMNLSPVDTSNSNNGTTAQTQSPGSTTPSQPNELAVACVCVDSSTGFANIGITDPPTNFTSLLVSENTSTDLGAEHCYRIKTTAAAENPTWTWTDSGTVLTQSQIVFFKAAPAWPAFRGKTNTLLRM